MADNQSTHNEELFNKFLEKNPKEAEKYEAMTPVEKEEFRKQFFTK